MKRGFTLVEVLITLVIVTGGTMALLMAFSLATGASRGTEEQETAVGIANAKMEELYKTEYVDLQDSISDSSAMFGAISGYTVTVKTTKPDNPAKVSVTVSWAAKGGTANVELVTLRASY